MKTKFGKSIKIGGLFLHRGKIWVRTDRDCATCIASGRSGACNFPDDEDPDMILLRGTKVEELILKNIKKLE